METVETRWGYSTSYFRVVGSPVVGFLFFPAIGIRRDFEVYKEEGDAKLQVVKPCLEMGEKQKTPHQSLHHLFKSAWNIL